MAGAKELVESAYRVARRAVDLEVVVIDDAWVMHIQVSHPLGTNIQRTRPNYDCRCRRTPRIRVHLVLDGWSDRGKHLHRHQQEERCLQVGRAVDAPKKPRAKTLHARCLVNEKTRSLIIQMQHRGRNVPRKPLQRIPNPHRTPHAFRSRI